MRRVPRQRGGLRLCGRQHGLPHRRGVRQRCGVYAPSRRSRSREDEETGAGDVGVDASNAADHQGSNGIRRRPCEVRRARCVEGREGVGRGGGDASRQDTRAEVQQARRLAIHSRVRVHRGVVRAAPRGQRGCLLVQGLRAAHARRAARDVHDRPGRSDKTVGPHGDQGETRVGHRRV